MLVYLDPQFDKNSDVHMIDSCMFPQQKADRYLISLQTTWKKMLLIIYKTSDSRTTDAQ